MKTTNYRKPPVVHQIHLYGHASKSWHPGFTSKKLVAISYPQNMLTWVCLKLLKIWCFIIMFPFLIGHIQVIKSPFSGIKPVMMISYQIGRLYHGIFKKNVWIFHDTTDHVTHLTYNWPCDSFDMIILYDHEYTYICMCIVYIYDHAHSYLNGFYQAALDLSPYPRHPSHGSFHLVEPQENSGDDQFWNNSRVLFLNGTSGKFYIRKRRVLKTLYEIVTMIQFPHLHRTKGNKRTTPTSFK